MLEKARVESAAHETGKLWKCMASVCRATLSGEVSDVVVTFTALMRLLDEPSCFELFSLLTSKACST